MDATFVLFVEKRQRGRLRSGLTPELLGEIAWRERRTLKGSEFYFSGPSTLARQAHAAAAALMRTSGPIGPG